MVGSMMSEMNKVIGAEFRRETTLAMVESDVAGESERPTAGGNAGSGASGESKAPPSVKVPAGSKFYGKLDVAIDSDNPGPVWGDILSGPLKGGKVMGGFEKGTGSVLITFNVLKFKGENYDILAYAIDPETESTAIADAVDRHILERYSSLLAAAFVEGYADAASGYVTTTNPDGTTVTQKSAMPDANDQLISAMGTVGKTLTPIMAERFNRPETVRVFDDRPVGILFAQKLEIQ